MKKTVFIIPGFKHQSKTKAYKAIATILRREGYSTVQVKIPWSKRTVSENTEYFLKEYKKVKRKNKYILGFSLGAMVAFVASTKVKSSGVILCSLSPFFKEDMKKRNRDLMSPLMLERYDDFTTLQSKILAKKVKTKQVHMLYGENEAVSLKKRVNETFASLPMRRKKLIEIHKTEHTLGSMRYLDTIHFVAKALQ